MTLGLLKNDLDAILFITIANLLIMTVLISSNLATTDKCLTVEINMSHSCSIYALNRDTA